VYSLRQPHPDLAPFVENYWAVLAPPDVGFDLTVDVFVDVQADLVLTFGAPYERSRRGIAAANSAPKAYGEPNLDAQRLYPIQIRQRGVLNVVGVRFRVGGLAPFIAVTAADLTGHTPPPEAAFGERVLPLVAQIRGTTGDLDAQAALLDAFFLERLSEGPASPGHRAHDSHVAFAEALAAITKSGGNLAITTVAERVGVSPRHLDRLFARFLGVSPKAYASVCRFRRVLERLKSTSRAEPGLGPLPPDESLAALAADAGYFDQSHLVRDFRRFAGGVPRGHRDYFPPEAPTDFAPNVVQYRPT
jgi:AraC-like DNA-binding protein